MVCWVSVWSLKILASYLRVARLLLVIGAIAVAGDGFWRAATISTVAVVALSFDPNMGMATLVGSQANVLLTCSALVS